MSDCSNTKGTCAKIKRDIIDANGLGSTISARQSGEGETTLTITTVSKFCCENLSILLSDKQGRDYKIFMCII